jgi:hypothetical protein
MQKIKIALKHYFPASILYLCHPSQASNLVGLTPLYSATPAGIKLYPEHGARGHRLPQDHSLRRRLIQSISLRSTSLGVVTLHNGTQPRYHGGLLQALVMIVQLDCAFLLFLFLGGRLRHIVCDLATSLRYLLNAMRHMRSWNTSELWRLGRFPNILSFLRTSVMALGRYCL